MPPLRVRVRLLTRLALTGAVTLSGFSVAGLSGFPSASAQELPRAFAPRALRLIGPDGRPLEGSCRDAHWNSRGTGLFFTLDVDGTRNIWRAYPSPKDKSRFPVWLASPVTKLRAPQGAARPVPFQGDRELVCLQQLDSKTTQLALLNIATGAFTPFAHTTKSPDDPAPAPDGKAVAFTSGRGDDAAIYLTLRDSNAEPRLLAAAARRPVWLDTQTVLYESLNSKKQGLYRISIEPNAQPEMVMMGGGEAGALPGGVGTVFAARPSSADSTRLYLIARDGSGLRVLRGTEGARRPVPSGNGTIVYDAPLEENGMRSLWVLRLEMGASNVEPLPGTRYADLGIATPPQTESAPPSQATPVPQSTPLPQTALIPVPLQPAPVGQGESVQIPPFQVTPAPPSVTSAAGQHKGARPSPNRRLANNRMANSERRSGRNLPPRSFPPTASDRSPVFPPVATASLVPPLPPLALPPTQPIAVPPTPLDNSQNVLTPVTSLGALSPEIGNASPSTPGTSGTAASPDTTASSSPLPPLRPMTNGNTPIGQLLSVRRAVLSSARLDDQTTMGSNSSEVLAIFGSLSGADVQAALEAGPGDAPARWVAIPITSASVSGAPFAFWNPPAGARGTWTIRLTVTNRRGAAQSFLKVQLPLPRAITATNPVSGLPLPPPAPVPTRRTSPTSGATPVPDLRPVPRPVPFGPAAPEPIPTPTPTSTLTPTPRSVRNTAPFKPQPVAPVPRRVPAQRPSVPATLPSSATFAGNFNISGTLATMAPGQKTRVTFWGLNRGNTTWQSGASGSGRVRLVARWVDFSTGTRRKWSVIWLKSPVSAGSRTNWEFDIDAPTRPGKYKLIYGLVRWPDDNNFSPPPYNAPQAAWMGEFSAIAFAIDVVPRSAP